MSSRRVADNRRCHRSTYPARRSATPRVTHCHGAARRVPRRRARRSTAARSARSCSRRSAMPAATCSAFASGLIELRGAPALSFVYRHATRDVTKNLDADDGLAAIAPLLDPTARPSFAHATLHAGDADAAAARQQEGQADAAPARDAAPTRATRRGAGATSTAPHDRAQARARLPLELPFLRRARRHRRAPSPGAGDGAQVEADRQVPRGARPRARRLPAATADGAPPSGRRLRLRQGLPDLRRPRVPAPPLRRARPR